MPVPVYNRTTDRARLALLMHRRGAMPAQMRPFPEPPTVLAEPERAAWEMFRCAFGGTGAVDAGSFPILEGMVFAFVMGNRIRALLARTPAGDPKRPGYERLIRQQDESLRSWLRCLAPTRAMLVHLAVYAPELVDRIGLPARDRRRVHAG